MEEEYEDYYVQVEQVEQQMEEQTNRTLENENRDRNIQKTKD